MANDVKSYRSINDLHHKYKAYAYHWQNKEEDAIIEEMNEKMRRKMKEIKSYLDVKGKVKYEGSRTSRVNEKEEEGIAESKQVVLDNPNKSSEALKKEKKPLSLHYRYRKRRQ